MNYDKVSHALEAETHLKYKQRENLYQTENFNPRKSSSQWKLYTISPSIYMISKENSFGLLFFYLWYKILMTAQIINNYSWIAKSYKRDET